MRGKAPRVGLRSFPEATVFLPLVMKKSIFTTGGRKKVTKTKLAVNLSDVS